MGPFPKVRLEYMNGRVRDRLQFRISYNVLKMITIQHRMSSLPMLSSSSFCSVEVCGLVVRDVLGVISLSGNGLDLNGCGCLSLSTPDSMHLVFLPKGAAVKEAEILSKAGADL